MRLKLEPTNLQNSKKKLVLVAVLGLVFIVVLYSSFRSSSSSLASSQPPAQSVPVALSPDASPTNPSRSDNTTSINRTSLADDSTKVVELITKAVLPKIDLDRIVSRNPFIDSAKLDSALQSTSERGSPKNSEGLARVDPATVQPRSNEQPKVDAVVTGGRRPAALINDKLYFENDTVDGIWVIEQILPKEVIFKPSGFSSQIQQPEKST